MAALISPSLYSPLEYFPGSSSPNPRRPQVQRTTSCPSPSLAFVQSLASSTQQAAEALVASSAYAAEVPSSLAWDSILSSTSQALPNDYTWTQNVPLPLNSQTFLVNQPNSATESWSSQPRDSQFDSPTNYSSTSSQWDIWEAFQAFCDNGNVESPALSYLTTNSIVAASALISEQSQLLEDAKANSPPSPNSHVEESALPSPAVSDANSIALSIQVDHRTKSKNQPSRNTKGKRPSASDQRTWNTQSSQIKYSNGKVIGSMEVWEPSKKVRKPRTTLEKEVTALNRSLGACPEHQKAHKKCRPDYYPYLRCLTSRLPIFGSRIMEMRLFRKGPAVGHPLESKRAELFDLQDIQGSMRGVIPVELTQGLGESLTVYVTEFAPRADDKLSHVWFDRGNKRILDLPPFCLTYLNHITTNLEDYVHRTASIYLENIVAQSSPVTRSMLRRAIELSKQPQYELVKDALNLIAISRMIENDWEIMGTETLGIPSVDDGASPWYCKRPIPPTMDTGLDQIVIQRFLTPLRIKVLARLQSQLQNMDNPFEIILTVFIMATHTEWLLRHSRKNALRYRAQHRYSSLELAAEYFHAHNILLSHFHYSSTNGHWLKGTALPAEESSFLTSIVQLLSSPLTVAQPQAHSYESELFWSRQVFQPDWKPCSLKIEECY